MQTIMQMGKWTLNGVKIILITYLKVNARRKENVKNPKKLRENTHVVKDDYME
jgi:hypothetical protein